MKHLGHRRTEDVAVQQSHLITQTCQGDGQIGRNGRFAYATLARADGNDVLHALQQLVTLRTRLRLELRLNLDLHVLATMVFDGCFSSFNGRLQERIGLSGELQNYADLIAIDGRLVSHHFTLYQVLLRAGIRHRGQRIHNQFGI